MKLAVITDEIGLDFEPSLDVMAEYGITGAELRQIGSKHVLDLTSEELSRVKRQLEQRGMHVVGIATPFYKCDMPGAKVDGPVGNLHSASATGLGDQIAMLLRSFEVAKFFDCNLVRVFSFWKRGPLTPEIEDTIVDAFVEPAALAADAGMILGLENEHACYIGTGAQTARILEKIDSPSVRSLWDPGNAFFDGELPFPTGYEAVKQYITHVHVKDAAAFAGTPGPEWTVVGEGQIDFKGQLSALKSAQYDGYLSLETHYNGKETKEASSRACLEGLLRLMKEIA